MTLKHSRCAFPLIAMTVVLAQVNDRVRAEQPPNIIVILTDDLGYNDFGCYGAQDIETPEVDRMADEGVKLTSFYVSPVCSPSRASLMTGCYSQRVGIGGVLFPRNTVGLSLEEQTLPELLRQRGYATALIGKWHLGFQPHQTPPNHGFDSWYGTLSSNSSPLSPSEQIYDFADDCVFRDGFTRELVGKTKVGCPLFRDNKIIEIPADQTQFTKRYTEESIRFISANKDKPFFLYLAHNMPHIPLHASPDFVGTSKRGLYGDVIQELDWGIGKVLKSIKDQGLDEKTLVILTSDNGPKTSVGGSAAPLRGEKGDSFEGGVRVPCIVRWPGKVASKQVTDEPVAIIDLLPTLVAIAGAEMPMDRVIDGKDIWPVLSGAKGAKSPHDAIYYFRGRTMKGVRVGDRKLIRDTVDTPKETVELTREERKLPRSQRKELVKKRRSATKAKSVTTTELFDLRADIGEQENQIDQHSELARRLSEMMESFHRELRANQRPPGDLN